MPKEFVRVCVHEYICPCVYMLVYVHKHIYIHTNTRAYIHTHTHTHFCPRMENFALLSSTNVLTPDILLLLCGEFIFTEITEYQCISVQQTIPELQFGKCLKCCTNDCQHVKWVLGNNHFYFTTRVFGHSAISTFLGGTVSLSGHICGVNTHPRFFHYSDNRLILRNCN